MNLTLHKAALTCLIGINGIGKTTLLRTMAGLQRPLSGAVFVSNTDIANMPPPQLARQVSIVLTDTITDRLMTVSELVATGRMPYTGIFGRLSDGDRKIVEDAMERLNITALADRRIHHASDGQRQRALLARAVAQQTPIMILDEPTAFLDYRSRAEAMELLRDFAHADGKSVLASTHEIDIAERMADYIWTAEAGGISCR